MIITDARILIADDQPSNVLLLQRMLEREGFTHVKTSTDAREVVPLFAAYGPDILLLDLHMPHLPGMEIMSRLRDELGADTYVPILVLTADISNATRDAALAAGAHDFLTKPFDAVEVVLRIRNLLQTRMLHVRLARKAEDQGRALDNTRIEVLERLASAAELRDNETHEHTQRVGDTAALLGRAIGLTVSEQEILRRAAPLHDIGKIGIADAVLLKPGPLTDAEFEHIKTHSAIGAELLADSSVPILQAAQVIALTHHERWDGTGYPNGLRRVEIPLHGRIVAVADVFDALTHSRPYKAAWSVEQAVAEMRSQRARQFDPDVIDLFLALVDSDQRVFQVEEPDLAIHPAGMARA
jgi:putative two-component system response regulator